MKRNGIRTLFYFQVDNPLVQIADPGFLGIHRLAEAEVSFKVVEKVHPDEKVGVVVEVGGRPAGHRVLRPPRPMLAERREPEGHLELWAGSIAIHVFERSFIEKPGVRRPPAVPPRDRRRSRIVDDSGRIGLPERARTRSSSRRSSSTPCPLAGALHGGRMRPRGGVRAAQERRPGPDSPATVRQRMSDLFAGWIEGAGAHRASSPG